MKYFTLKNDEGWKVQSISGSGPQDLEYNIAWGRVIRVALVEKSQECKLACDVGKPEGMQELNDGKMLCGRFLATKTSFFADLGRIRKVLGLIFIRYPEPPFQGGEV